MNSLNSVRCLLAVSALWLAVALPARAQDALSSLVSSVCSGTGTLTTTLQQQCDAAKAALLQNAISMAATSSVSAQTSLTTAYLSALQSSLAVNTATLTAIKATTTTMPDMLASIDVEMVQAMKKAAENAAPEIVNAAHRAAQPGHPTKLCTSGTVFMAEDRLAQALRNRKTALAAADLLSEQIDRLTIQLNAVTASTTGRVPITIPGLVPAPGARLDFAPPTLPAVAIASLGLDLIGKTAALATSFKPATTSNSGTITADLTPLASSLLVPAIASVPATTATIPLSLVEVSTVLAPGSAANPSSVRDKLESLRSKVRDLQVAAARVASYDFSHESAEQQQKQKDAISAATTLTTSADTLRAQLFQDTGATATTPAAAAPIDDIDRVEGSGLLGKMGNECVFSLRVWAGPGKYDRNEHSGLITTKFQLRAVATLSWVLADATGRILGSGTEIADSSWKQFDPK